MGWKQYLDEVANAGYVWTELGPQGFLPQDPQQLRDELDQRGLKVCGGTVFAGLHKGKEALDKAIAEFSQEAKLLREVGAKYLIQLPGAVHRHAHRCGCSSPADMDPEQWSNLISGTNELGRVHVSRSSASSWCSIRTPTPTSTPRTGSRSSSRTPTRSSSTSAWTPGTSPTAVVTTCRSSSTPRSGSPTCT